MSSVSISTAENELEFLNDLTFNTRPIATSSPKNGDDEDLSATQLINNTNFTESLLEAETNKDSGPETAAAASSTPIHNLKKDKVLNNDLWMMQCKAANFDIKTVIELGVDSGVFIKKAALKRSISRANNENTLARQILLELFSIDALNNSSIDGKAIDEGEKKTAITRDCNNCFVE
ncbi:uncharacterized protein LOC122502983 [Leptopilina heterotoma]|uniref:uncharacterized protein LOC122502983 n=1 Tax=Leptopilina heterotoma TaxID=63436 RepID=UPI001CA7E23F|nr:uncharacterized protein LOC122502983 [Leptopilina heterotoma]